MVALTIGVPTYNDFDGVDFTVQALRLYQSLEDTEIVVVDNFGCDHTRRFVEGIPEARYVLEPVMDFDRCHRYFKAVQAISGSLRGCGGEQDAAAESIAQQDTVVGMKSR